MFPSFGTFKKVVTEFGQGFNAKVHICENMNTAVFISKLTHASIQTVNPSISAPLQISAPPVVLQAAIILVAMVSGKNIWRLKFWQKSTIGELQIKRETYVKNNQ